MKDAKDRSLASVTSAPIEIRRLCYTETKHTFSIYCKFSINNRLCIRIQTLWKIDTYKSSHDA